MQHAGSVDVLLGEVIGTTLGTWEGEVGCEYERPDCMGLFKTQKGFNGRVPDIGLLIADAYPMITIWSEGP